VSSKPGAPTAQGERHASARPPRKRTKVVAVIAAALRADVRRRAPRATSASQRPEAWGKAHRGVQIAHVHEPTSAELGADRVEPSSRENTETSSRFSAAPRCLDVPMSRSEAIRAYRSLEG